MPSYGQSVTLQYVAWDTAANAGKTGDNANHTLRWVKDGTSAATTNSASEVDSTNAPGIYKITLTATECQCQSGTLCGKSSTSGVVVLPMTYTFENLPTASFTAGALLTVGTGAGQINPSSGAVPVSGDLTSTMKASVNTECDTALSDYGALRPTTAGRTLDVSAGGEAGVDWANVGSSTTTLNLSGTTISTSQAVASVAGAVGSVTGAVGSVSGAVGSVTGAVGSVTGDVGGNVVGSVASVTSKTGFKLASDGLDQIAITDPGGVADTWPKMVVQTWRRFFKKAAKDANTGEIYTYADNGTTVRTTQSYTDDGAGNETQGAAS